MLVRAFAACRAGRAVGRIHAFSGVPAVGWAVTGTSRASLVGTNAVRALGLFSARASREDGKERVQYGAVLAALGAAAVGVTATVSEVFAAPTDSGRVPRGRSKVEEHFKDMTTIDHIFKYYASVTQDGERYMTTADFVCALTPYVSQLIKDRNGKKIRMSKDMQQVVSIVDANGDGMISYDEYAFFVAMLRLPVTQLPPLFIMFDQDGNGELDQDEFVTLVDALRKKASRGKSTRVNRSQAEGVIKFLFKGKDSSINYKRFVEFSDFLKVAVLKHEFSIHDKDHKGYLSPFRFARSVLSFSHTRHIIKYQERASRMLDLEGKVTFKQYQDFQEVMKDIQQIFDACAEYGNYREHANVMVKDDFLRATKFVTGIELDDMVVDIIFDLFSDVRGPSGELELDQKFVDIMLSNVNQSPDNEGHKHKEKKKKMSLVACAKMCLQSPEEEAS